MCERCPICDSRARELDQRARGARGLFEYECSDCGLQFLNIWNDVELVGSFYRDLEVVYESSLQPGPLKYNEYERRLEEVRPYLRPESNLLEIGAGQGRFLDLVRPLVANVHACEASPQHASALRAKGFHVWEDMLSAAHAPSPYDVVCMYAVLEHIPNVREFLQDLRRWMHPGSVLFIECPNQMEPLARFYDVPAFRDFFYREYHLYTFSEATLQRLLAETGYGCVTRPIQVASITNHFHWLHTSTTQGSMNDMVNVTLPGPLRNRKTPRGEDFVALLDRVDDFYRSTLEAAGVGDILGCRAWPADSESR